MQNRMFDPAYILINWHPIRGRLFLKGLICVWVRISQEIPGAFKKRIKRICLPPRLCPARRTICVCPCGMAIQRVAWCVKLHIFWQSDGELIFWNRDWPAGRAMNNRDRAAPIALTRHTQSRSRNVTFRVPASASSRAEMAEALPLSISRPVHGPELIRRPGPV